MIGESSDLRLIFSLHFMMEDKGGGEKVVTPARACSPQYVDRRGSALRGKGDRKSIRSDASIHEASSCTESERALRERAGLPGEGGPLKEESVGENRLPEKAAQVFSPAVTVLPSHAAPKDDAASWEMESEKSPFLNYTGGGYDQHAFQYEWTERRAPTRRKYPFFILLVVSVCRAERGGAIAHVSACLPFLSFRGSVLFRRRHVKDGRVLDDVSNNLPGPGVGGLCLPAL